MSCSAISSSAPRIQPTTTTAVRRPQAQTQSAQVRTRPQGVVSARRVDIYG